MIMSLNSMKSKAQTIIIRSVLALGALAGAIYGFGVGLAWADDFTGGLSAPTTNRALAFVISVCCEALVYSIYGIVIIALVWRLAWMAILSLAMVFRQSWAFMLNEGLGKPSREE
jgi:hypothetical protein